MQHCLAIRNREFCIAPCNAGTACTPHNSRVERAVICCMFVAVTDFHVLGRLLRLWPAEMLTTRARFNLRALLPRSFATHSSHACCSF